MDSIHSSKKAGDKYQLRHAAGLYWLLDMEQSGPSYVRPVPLNEGGAQLFKLFASGMSEADVCGWLCENYDVSPEQAQRDVHDFVQQLRSTVDFGGQK